MSYSWGIADLDEFLPLPNKPVLACGVPEVGKTILSVHLASNAIKNNLRVLFIDTEDDPTKYRVLEWYKKRLELTETQVKHLHFQEPDDIFELAKFLGIVVQVTYHEQKASVAIKYPKKWGKEVDKVATTSRYADWWEVSPLKELMEKENYDLLILDSLARPIKETVSKETQDLPARGTLLEHIAKILKHVSKKLKILTFVTNHSTRSPMKQAILDPWGGDTVKGVFKFRFTIMHPDSKLSQAYSKFARRFVRDRWAGLFPGAMLPLHINKDFGYVTLDEAKI